MSRLLKSVVLLSLPAICLFLLAAFEVYQPKNNQQYMYTRSTKRTLNKGSAEPHSKTETVTVARQSFRGFVELPDNMTLVSSYFDLGVLPKGNGGAKFNKEKYKLWASVYKYILNPLVVYTDSDDFFKYMMTVRADFSFKTKVIKIERNSTWAFQLLDKIKAVFSQPGYPRHPPNTINPAYSASQHSKYPLVVDAIRHNYFKNEFYAWVDIGYFRNSVSQNRYLQLFAPSDLNREKLAINQVWGYNKNMTPHLIFRRNIVWVGGGMFIGTPNLLLEFEKLYKRAVNYFLDRKLMNTDQQVLYSIYSQEGRNTFKPKIELQLYVPGKYPGDPWFYLGYHCRLLYPAGVCPPHVPVCPTTNTIVNVTTASMINVTTASMINVTKASMINKYQHK